MLETILEIAFSKWSAIIAVTAVGIWWYFKEKMTYFEKRGIPGPKPLPILGNILAVMTEVIAERQMRYAKLYGRIYGMYFTFRTAISIAEPEMVKQVLVKDFHKFADRLSMKFNDKTWDCMLFTSNYEDWKRLRILSSPTFSSGKMKKMYSTVQECIKLLDDEIVKIASSDGEINLKKTFGNLTMDVICRCAFAIQTNTHNDPNNAFVQNSLRFFKQTFGDKLRVLAFMLNPILRCCGFSLFNPEPLKNFRKIIRGIIAKREHQIQSDGKKPNDFLQLMLDSRNHDITNEEDDQIKSVDSAESHHIQHHQESITASSNITKQSLNEDELLAQCFVFLVAGYETTATVLNYLFYSLALNPDIQNRLFEEIKANENEKGEFDYETLAQLPYLDACISETLRLFCPVVHLDRCALEDTKLGDLDVPKGTIVQIPVYAIHHDKEFYPEPFKFDPERFLPENRDKLVPYTYLPFGAGPRNCIGLRFALVEAKLATVEVLKKFKFIPNKKTMIPVKFTKVTNPLLQCEDLIVSVVSR